MTAGTDLTGGGTSGNVTLNLDTTKVPQLHASNSFTGNQSVTGNLTVSGNVNAATFDNFPINSFAFQNGTNTFASQQLFNGNVLEMLVGDPGCGSGFAGIGFGALSGCNNYSLMGDGTSTYINRPAAGTLDFREGNSEQMTIVPGGHIGIGTSGPVALLAVTNATTETNSSPIDGIAGECGTSNCTGVDAIDNSPAAGVGLFALSNAGAAGVFVGLVSIAGNLNVIGSITAGTKDFLVDHPLDPANKYLYHASVESSQMKNIYDGTVTTDGSGDAVVQLPDWFEAVNTDFRYQLTVIGQFAQAIVAGEIANHQFGIKTDKPNVKVSWQVTGVRQDAFAKAHPLQVEVEKSQRERGYYIHPKLYGAPEEKGLEWALYPERMKRMKETRAAPTPPQLANAK